MRAGRPTPLVVLTVKERNALERWARRHKRAPVLARRARIVLACAAGQTNVAVADAAGVTRQMVGRWRCRFVGQRLGGLLDAPRPGAPRRITDGQARRVLRLLATTPSGGDRPSTRTVARRCGLSQTTVSRIWRAGRLRRSRSR